MRSISDRVQKGYKKCRKIVVLVKCNNFMYFSDCASCFNEIFAATADCAFSTIWLQCIQGIIGEGNPCYGCICEVVPDACLALGCGFSC